MRYQAWTFKELQYLKDNHKKMTAHEMADGLERSYGSVRNKLTKMKLSRKRNYVEYALYEGENIVFIGTKKECAEYWGVKESSITFMATPSYRKRIEGKPNRRLVEKL